MWLPFAIESGGKGGPRNARITVERAEVNVAVDDAWFKLPAPRPRSRAVIVAGPAETRGRAVAAAAGAAGARRSTAGTISGLGARNIGSATMSGRDRRGRRDASRAARRLLYVGAASGGVWKSQDGGTTFKPVFDKQPVQSIGAIAIDPEQPEDGVGRHRRVMDAQLGVGRRRHLQVDRRRRDLDEHGPARAPSASCGSSCTRRTSSVVYACVPGKLWSDSTDRGLYKTADGGKTWTLVLKGGNASTGCSSVTMDPKNPDVLLAGMWDFRRKGWTFRSGGDGPDAPSGSGLHRSTDGGKTWTSITTARRACRPAPWGRVEVVYAPSDGKRRVRARSSRRARRCSAPTTAARPGSSATPARSWCGGRSTSRASIVDPTNPNRLFKPDLRLIVSEDGGKQLRRHRRRLARRLARPLDRADQPQARDRRRRRRAVDVVRRRQLAGGRATTFRSRSSIT